MAGNLFSGSPFWVADPVTGQPGGVKITYGGVDSAAQADTADGLATSATANKQSVAARNYYFNGTTWDRSRGDVGGAYLISVPSITAASLSTHSILATADTNARVVKASKGVVYAFQIFNNTAAAKYVKLYNKATAPVIGTDTPVRRLIIPASGVVSFHAEEGRGAFTTGIAYVATGAAGDADATALAAGDLAINIDYF